MSQHSRQQKRARYEARINAIIRLAVALEREAEELNDRSGVQTMEDIQWAAVNELEHSVYGSA